MAVQGIAALLPILAKIPGALKWFYKSKAFWPTVVTGGMLGTTAMGEMGRKGERELTKEQLELQRLLGESSAEVTKKLALESKENTKEYIKTLLAAKREERKQEIDRSLMDAFMQSQDRRMAMTMQAIQGQTAPRTGGMSGVLRSTF